MSPPDGFPMSPDNGVLATSAATLLEPWFRWSISPCGRTKMAQVQNRMASVGSKRGRLEAGPGLALLLSLPVWIEVDGAFVLV